MLQGKAEVTNQVFEKQYLIPYKMFDDALRICRLAGPRQGGVRCDTRIPQHSTLPRRVPYYWFPGTSVLVGGRTILFPIWKTKRQLQRLGL
jgi:hypothetical protein